MKQNPQVISLIEEASGDGGRVVSAVESIIDHLLRDNLAYKMRVPPAMVGIHPCNRDGYGVSEAEVHELGSMIVAMGWSWPACQHATAMEEDDEGNVAKFSMKLKNSAMGLADTVAGEIKFGSLACSHTNQFLHAVIAGVPSTIDSLCTDDRMSKSKLAEKDPALADALDKGLEWLILKKEVGTLCPTLPDLVQNAKNASGQAQRMETEVQLLSRIHSLAQSMSSSTVDGQVVVDWSAVQRAVLRRKVPEPSEVPDLVKYVQRWGGGVHGTFLKDLSSFHQQFVRSGRIVPGTTFKALADLRLSPDELVPYLATAVVKTQASCPDNRVSNKVCRFIAPSDIASIEKSNKKAAMEAEEVLRTFRAMVSDMSMDRASETRFFGRLDTTVVRHVFSKPLAEHYDNLQQVALHFMKELEGLASRPSSSGNIVPRQSSIGGPEASSSSAGSVPNYVQFGPDGKASEAKKVTLLNKGFFPGAPVSNSVSGVTGVIRSIDIDGSVVVERSSPIGGCTTESFEEFVAGWGKTKSAVETLEGWQKSTPKGNRNFAEVVCKAQVQVALNTLLSSVDEPAVRLQTKPCKGCFAEAAFAKHKLQLAPMTYRVQACAAGHEPPQGSWPCKVGGSTFHLVPIIAKEFVVPFWYVRVVSDIEESATMEVVYKTITVSAKAGKEPQKIDIEIPMLQNKDALDDGKELIVYRPAPAPKKKAPKRDMVLSLGKEAKKSKA